MEKQKAEIGKRTVEVKRMSNGFVVKLDSTEYGMYKEDFISSDWKEVVSRIADYIESKEAADSITEGIESAQFLTKLVMKHNTLLESKLLAKIPEKTIDIKKSSDDDIEI